MTEEALRIHIELGRDPVTVHCEKMYDGICRMIRIAKDNLVFLDYDDTDDAGSEGAFRVTFQFDSLVSIIRSIANFTGKPLEAWQANAYNPEDFACDSPAWRTLQWDVYHGKIPLLSGSKTYWIGSLFWRGLAEREITPESSPAELTAWLCGK